MTTGDPIDDDKGLKVAKNQVRCAWISVITSMRLELFVVPYKSVKVYLENKYKTYFMKEIITVIVSAFSNVLQKLEKNINMD